MGNRWTVSQHSIACENRSQGQIDMHLRGCGFQPQSFADFIVPMAFSRR